MADKKYVVGIGASAGGLEAVKLLLANLQKTGQYIYIIAQHMATDSHMQLMLKLMAAESKLPVSIAENAEDIEADHVYLIPAGYDGFLVGSKVYLQPLTGSYYSKPSVNFLFNSIAKEYGAAGIGIILSGAGTDGVAGCRAIKSSAGLTLAQEVETAQFDGMPAAAIEAGVIEYVTAPENMGTLLVSRLQGVQSIKLTHARYNLHVSADHLSKLLELILINTGLDFSKYKEETLIRRIKSRITYLKAKSVVAYIGYCTLHPDELINLKQMFLVTMSSFFRDKLSFLCLKSAMSEMLHKKSAVEGVHIMVPACASGEECYSIAITVAEIFEQQHMQNGVHIIGCDLNPNSILKAQDGLYQEKSLKEMDVQLVDKYFIKEDNGYRVVKAIQNMCTFVERDVFAMTAPDKFDLISCRNLLIYFKAELQQQLIKKFYHDLKPEGLLFLGQAENLGLYGGQYFIPVDYSHRIYRRRPN